MKIPSMDFRGQKIVNEDGTFTDSVQNFFDTLHTLLINNLGDEGLVMPTQSASNITLIQDALITSPTGIQTPSCEFGTLIYDATTNQPLVALDDGSGNPLFKTIVTM
jgi:hypothetical protein